MKHITLLAAMLLCAGTYAQEETTPEQSDIFNKKHEVKIGAIKMLAGPILEGTYEYVYSKDFTFGSSALVSFIDDREFNEKFSITPFARFYFTESKEYGAKGFFVEGFAKFLTGSTYEYEYVYYDVTPEQPYYYGDREIKTTFTTGAVGLCLGWKWVNHSGFVFEILAGGGRMLSDTNGIPDAIFRGDLNIGYRF